MILERIKGLVADLARPFAIISTSFAASWASVVVAYRVGDGNDGALFIGAVYAGVGALYIGKAWEIAKTSGQAAEVEKAKAAAAPPASGEAA